MTDMTRPEWLPEAWRHETFYSLEQDQLVHAADRVHGDGTWHQCQWRHGDPDNIAMARDTIAAGDAEHSP